MAPASWYEAAPGVWRRPFHGAESMHAELCQFDGFATICSGVTLQSARERDSLVASVRQGWIALRYRHPCAAYRSNRPLASQKGECTFEYTVPSEPDAVEQWADQTYVYHQTAVDKSGLADEVRRDYRKSAIIGSGDYLSSLHLAQDPTTPQEYHLYIYTPHSVTDGRGSLLVRR